MNLKIMGNKQYTIKVLKADKYLHDTDIEEVDRVLILHKTADCESAVVVLKNGERGELSGYYVDCIKRDWPDLIKYPNRLIAMLDSTE